MSGLRSSTRPAPRTIPEHKGDGRSTQHRYWHYLFTTSVLVISLCVLALLNACLHFADVSSYDVSVTGVPSSILLAGYLGMFFSILVLPVPDYVLVPVYGSLSAVGIFNPVLTFLVCVAASVFPIEYVLGRFLARPFVHKILPFFLMNEKELEEADRWVLRHGKFSVFISTFVPFFYSAVCLVAGTLRMRAVPFLLSCVLGFGLRFAFLEYAGYKSIYIFSSAFDYSQRFLFVALIVASTAYAGLYLAGVFRRLPTAG